MAKNPHATPLLARVWLGAGSSGSTAVVAILVIAILAIGAYFLFFAPTTAAPPFATDTPPAPFENILPRPPAP